MSPCFRATEEHRSFLSNGILFDEFALKNTTNNRCHKGIDNPVLEGLRNHSEVRLAEIP